MPSLSRVNLKTHTRVEHPTTKIVGHAREREPPPPPEESPGRYYLLVFQDDRSWMVQLPEEGSVVIGRADDVDLQLPGKAVSRRHARLTLKDGVAQVVDLDSQNGVWVNGERINAARTLSSGDSVSISETSLIYHANSPPRPVMRRRALDSEHFRERVLEELERAHRFARELVLVILLPSEGVDPQRFEELLTSVVRLIDVASVDHHPVDHTAQFYVLMPETGAADAAAAVARISRELAAVDPRMRVGYACSPADGSDLDSLFTSARDAARVAVRGEARAATATSRAFELGDVEVVVAEPSMIRLYALIERLAASSLPVLITGETGTGKEVAASAIHYWSARKDGPFVTLNCAALQEGLVESELFGHERGAFTGAVSSKPGLLEAGSGGTVFLDEIGELTASAQAKLLRVLETKRVMRVGDVREREIDIRIVAATHHDIEQEARVGRFRQDLFFRLSGATVWLPPLRDRPRELPQLARSLLRNACAKVGRPTLEISVGAMRYLARHRWPGNIRELRNVMEYMAATVPGDVLEADHLDERIGRKITGRPVSSRTSRADQATARVNVTPTSSPASTQAPPPAPEPKPEPEPEPRKTFRPIAEEVRELEIRRMSEALAATGGVQTQAANLIDMPLRTFVNKLKRYGLKR